MSRRSLVAALVVAMVGGLYVMRPIGAQASVASVTGSAFGAFANNISLFGSPQPPNGPHPTVTLPSGGGSVQQTDPDGHVIAYGPAELFVSGALTVESSGTTGATGSVTSRSHIVGDATGVDPFRWSDLTQTCNAATNGATSGTTTIVDGTVTSTTGTTSVPTNPPPNHTVTGVVPGANDNFRIVFNERSVDAAGVLTITAAHIYLLGPTARGDLFIGQVQCGVTMAPPAAPVAGDDVYSTPYQTVLNVPVPGVLANDSDANGDAMTAEMPTTPANGSVVLNTNGSFTYTPNAGFSGTDSFEYMVHDPGGLMDTGLVTITVGAPPNRPPVAVNDNHSTPYQTVLNVGAPGVLGNDSDPDGNALTAVLVAQPANGSVTLNANGSFTFTPAAGFSGTTSFTYQARDTANALSNTATVNVTVGAPPNRPPAAVNDAYSTAYQTVLNVAAPGVLANDSDPDGNALTAVLVAQPASGSVTLNANGSFTFTPAAGFSGTTSFTYQARDTANALSNTATVNVTVGPRPNTAPVANPDTYSTAYQTTLNVAAPGVLANDTDADGDSLTAGMPSDPPNGAVTMNLNGSFSYTPDAGFSGTDSFTYMAHDPSNAMSTGTVTITVGAPPNRPPAAVNDAYSTAYQTALNVAAPGVLANDTDPDGNTLTAVNASQPANGSVTLNANGSFTFTPAAGFSGTTSFTYQARDTSNALSNTATVNVTVGAAPNRPPVAVDDTHSTPYQTVLNVAAPGVLANDTDPDGNSLTAVLVAQPANGSVTLNANGSFTFTPAAGFSGPTSFTYQARDTANANSNVATVAITVGAPPNRPPVAVDDPYSTAYQTPLTVAAPGVLANDTDPDGDTLTAHLVSGPANGTLTLGNDGSFTYSPNAGFSGPDTFTYLTRDPADASDTGMVTITVGPRPNTAPVANDDGYGTDYQTALNVAAPGVLANDTDADGDTLTAVNGTQPANGSVTLNADGSFTFTPNAGFSGTTTFTYVARDSFNANSGPATVTITVRPPPPVAPVAADDAYSTNYETALAVNAPGVLFNDTDGNNDPLTAVLVAGPANGTLVLNANGSFSYTPAAGFSGPDSFTYRASDGALTSNVATVTVTVGARSASADVSVTITDSTDPVGVRGDLTYTITVANAGPDAADGVSALVSPPPGSRIQSFAGATCMELKGRMKGLACELGTLAPGSSVQFTLTITAPPKPGTITAEASTAATTADPNQANNTASEQTVVVRP